MTSRHYFPRKPSRLAPALLALLALCLAHTSALALDPNHAYYDYYDKSKPPKNLLWMVESYHMDKAVNKMNAGNFGGSRGELKFILDYFPNHPKALAIASRLSLASNQPQIAETFFGEAMRLFPKTAQTDAIYANHLQRQKKYARAVEYYDSAIEKGFATRDVHYNLGLALFRTGQYDRANSEAQIAYGMNYPKPGLRNLLKKKNRWVELPRPDADKPGVQSEK